MDDSRVDGQFAETRAVWWAGVAVALLVTFAVLGGLLGLGVSLLAYAGLADLSYWLPAVMAATLSVILVGAAVKQGDSRYEPQ